MNRRELIKAMLAAPAALAIPAVVHSAPAAPAIEPLIIRVGPGIQGTFIWFGGLRETTTAVGDTTTYAYDADFAVAIAEGPIKEGITRIWAYDLGQYLCIYDKRLRQADESEADYAARVALTAEIEKRLTVYPGTETQPASPLIESYEGKGRVSSYRGLHYVTLEKFPVEQFGNRVPELWFETA